MSLKESLLGPVGFGTDRISQGVSETDFFAVKIRNFIRSGEIRYV